MDLCCIDCFNDQTLRDFIEAEGKRGTCSFCKRENKYCIDPQELYPLFEPVVGLYSIIEDFMPLYDLKQWDGYYIWEQLQNEWEIFSSHDYQTQEALMSAIFSDYDYKTGPPQILHSFVEIPSEYWGTYNEPSEEMTKIWQDFCSEIIYRNRYFPDSQVDLDALRELLDFLSQELEPKTNFYRARITPQKEKYSCKNIGKPPVEKTKHGRANPKGISYLYLSSNRETAVTEVRPFVGAFVTVGMFKNNESLHVVDLRNPIIDSPFKYGDSLEYYISHLEFLRMLGYELSKTVNPRDAELEYIPLQYLCEFIKNNDYDGVIYKSSASDGHNFAIFADDKLKCTRTELVEVEERILSFSKIS
jgi:hypothetical protein